MKRSFFNSIFVALAVACVASARPVEEPLGTPETSPAAVIRDEYAAPTATAAPAHSATVALPPPLTVAYQDQCNPCCANCVTYSDLHIDTDCDDPAAPRSSATPAETGDASLLALTDLTTATDAASLAATTTMPAAATTTTMPAAASPAATITTTAAAMSPAAAIITTMTAAATTMLAAIMSLAAAMSLAAVTITMALSSTATTTTTAAVSTTAATTARTTAAAMSLAAATITTTTAAVITTMMTAAAITTTTTAASASSTTAAARSCIKDPCGNRCVETHHCYAPNTCPCPCKENLSTECCITHCIVEPPCGCGCCCCGKENDGFGHGCCCNNCCPTPVCTPSFQGSQAPQMFAAPSTAPMCPSLSETAPNCPTCSANVHTCSN
ncbi:hypothetical protein FB645_000309 [Coemansia sp. IMI 203386]|nr:hypothetical protein FB645_000309 [Coemansia sp. IMI 203386]